MSFGGGGRHPCSITDARLTAEEWDMKSKTLALRCAADSATRSRRWMIARTFPLALAAGATVGFDWAQADPVQWSTGVGGNGHYYQFVQSPGITWQSAKLAAAALTYQGLTGHLVTVTGAQENAFLVGQFGTLAADGDNPWIGL